MNVAALISAGTAFVISAGGALGVVGISAGPQIMLGKTAVITACVVGAVSAAKDLRSLYKLPPVNGLPDTTKPAP